MIWDLMNQIPTTNFANNQFAFRRGFIHETLLRFGFDKSNPYEQHPFFVRV
jgi:hypothetical protein